MREATLKRINVLQAAIFGGATYFLMTLIFILPFFAFMSSVAGSMPSGSDANIFKMFSGAMMFMLPFIYGFIGFVSTAILTFCFNLVARVVGGIKIKFEAESVSDPTFDSLHTETV